MGKKNRQAYTAMPSTAENDSDSSSFSEGEELPPTPPPPAPSAADRNPPAHKKRAEPPPQKATDSESDSDGYGSPANPIASKPMDDRSKLMKPRSETNYKPSNPVASPSKTPAKRAPGVAEEKDLKKPKKEKRGGAEEEGKKSKLFQRLWSDADEIAILKGILQYKEKKGADPMTEASDFHDFIKSSLDINVDRSQMVGKVRRLKKRYEYSVTKKKTFSAHERNAFELSKKIWGNNGANVSPQTEDNMKSTAAAGRSAGLPARMVTVAINGVTASPSEMKGGGISGSSQEEVNNGQFIGKATISMGLDENIVKIGLGLCKEDKKAEIEDKWRQLHLEESNLLLKKLDLAREESKMVIEALKSGDV